MYCIWAHRSTAVMRLTVYATVVGSIFNRGNYLYIYISSFWSQDKARRWTAALNIPWRKLDGAEGTECLDTRLKMTLRIKRNINKFNIWILV